LSAQAPSRHARPKYRGMGLSSLIFLGPVTEQNSSAQINVVFSYKNQAGAQLFVQVVYKTNGHYTILYVEHGSG